MSLVNDPRVDLARARSITEVLEKLPLIDGLKRNSGELTGPCPKCGGHDRFSISTRKNLYNCRSCGGGGPIDLVMLVMGCLFMEAVEVLEGDRSVDIDPAELERRRETREKQRRKDEQDAERYRKWAIRDAVSIWTASQDFWGTLAEDYLALRVPGFESLRFPFKCFRFLPDLPYVKKINKRNHTLHSGPVLIAAVQSPDGRLRAVHRTWIDLSKPKGKAQIFAPDGEALPAKMVRGSKQGGAIRLTGSACTSTLVSGEGIETTATALVAGVYPGASYWAGVDLGNMSGKRIGGKFSEDPDMTCAKAFVPPSSVEDYWLIQDGDSEPRQTHAQLVAGARRAMRLRPGLAAHIVPADAGVDLNDMIRRPCEQ
jgi:hypothetical protein